MPTPEIRLPLALLLALFAARAVAAEPPAAPLPCAGAAGARPPDPRCGETLDGRPPETEPTSLKLERGALWAPKEVSLALVWPIVRGTDFIESHHLPGWYEAILTSDDGRVGVRPELNIATGFLPTGGARLFYRRLPGEGSELMARIVTAGPPVAIGQLQLRSSEPIGVTLSASAEHRTDRLFAGIGPNSQSTLTAEGHGLARYGENIARFDGGWVHRLPLRLHFLAHGDIQRRDYESDHVRAGESVAVAFGLPAADCAALGQVAPCVDPAEMPGFYRGLRMAHGGVGLAWNARDRARGGSGVEALVDASAGWGVAGDPTRDLRFAAEADGVIAGTDRALLFRAWAAMVEPRDGTIVPFDELVSPCGVLGMRGFPDGRFRGESGAVGTVEYRYYIAWNVDATVFSDVGTVAGARFSDIGSSRWFPDFGLGLRFYSPRSVHWEALATGGLQVTYAPDQGFRVLFNLAQF